MSDRHFDALASVRRLILTGNNKSFWRERERQLLTAIADQSGEAGETRRGSIRRTRAAVPKAIALTPSAQPPEGPNQ